MLSPPLQVQWYPVRLCPRCPVIIPVGGMSGTVLVVTCLPAELRVLWNQDRSSAITVAMAFCAGWLAHRVLATRSLVHSAASAAAAAASPKVAASTVKSNDQPSAGAGSSVERREVPPGDLKMVLIVRSDLKMQPGKTAAQCGHATLGAYKKSLRLRPEYVEAWETRAQVTATAGATIEAPVLLLDRALSVWQAAAAGC